MLGSLRFGRGDDSLTFGTGSYITGNVDGGGGTNDLTLDADLNKSGTLQGGVANFSSITKTGQGGWSILGQIPVDEGGGTYPPGGSPVSGALAHITKIMVNEGLLSIAGAAPDFTGAIEVSSPGRLSVQAQSINNNTGVRNYGNLVFDQPFNDAYTGAAITGSGMVIKQGTGDLTMNANGVNTYTGGTWIAEGALVVDADTDLGAATGVVLLGTDNNRGNLNGVLKFASSFDLATTRAIDLRDGGGTFDTNGFNTTIAQTVSGTGGLTKAGAGVLELHGINTYQGATEVKGGTLGINSDTSLGKSGTRLVLYDSTTLRLDANTGLMNRPVSLAGLPGSGMTIDT